MSEKRQSNSPITERVERATILGLVRCAANNQVQELEWKNEAGQKIHVRLKPRGFFDGDDTSAQSPPVTAYLEPVFAPKSGLFERVKGEAAASDGQFVKKGQLLGFILIDLLLQPVRAPFDGIVNALGHQQGDRIASGDLLFKIATTRENSP